MNYFPFHIGDYASKTRHLSWDEDMAYRRLLDIYYTSECPLPLELRSVYRLVLASTDAQREAVKVILEEFFDRTSDGWRNHRADEELACMLAKQQAARDKANKRWGSRMPQHMPSTEPSNASAMLQHAGSDAAASESDAKAMLPTPTPTPTPTPKRKDSASALRAAPPPASDLIGDPEPRTQPATAPVAEFTGTNEDEMNCRQIAPMSASFVLPEDWGIDAEKLGFKGQQIVLEAEKMRQYFVSGKGKGTRRSARGWRQTWSNWLEKAAVRSR